MWIKGLYLVLEDAAWGRCRLPPAELLTIDVPVAFKKLQGFCPQFVREHFLYKPADAPFSPDEVYTAPGVAEVTVRDEEEAGFVTPPPAKKAKILKFYSLAEMEIFEDMMKIHASKTRHLRRSLRDHAHVPEAWLHVQLGTPRRDAEQRVQVCGGCRLRGQQPDDGFWERVRISSVLMLQIS